MDGHDFDDLVKRLTQTRLTRFEALSGLIASVAVSLTGASLTENAAAAERPIDRLQQRKRKQRNATNDTSGSCDSCEDEDNCCNGVCVNLSTDNNNCGRCGVRCDLSKCERGDCCLLQGDDCGPPFRCCDGLDCLSNEPNYRFVCQ